MIGAESLLAATVAALLAFLLSLLQSLIGSQIGSDTSVQRFLIERVRGAKHKLFVRVPGLLNEVYCGSFPLYLNWIFAFLPRRAVDWAELLLNPTINAAHVAVFLAIASTMAISLNLPITWMMITPFVFALTPQLFHAFSARTFGFSARGIAIILLSMFFLATFGAISTGEPIWWISGAVVSYLLFGFSTFGAQALVIIAALLSLVRLSFVPIGGALAGLVIFILMHPRYSLTYLRYTTHYIIDYARELAGIYILERRYSIWRDLVWDVWRNLIRDPVSGFRYAYENSVFIVLLLNPLALVVIADLILTGGVEGEVLLYSRDVALCGIVAALLTSFRTTRFLGEPERYVEAVTPWIAATGSVILFTHFGLAALVAVVATFFVADVVQVIFSAILARKVKQGPLNLSELESRIADFSDAEVRFASNNEHITKRLLPNGWKFSYCMTIGQGYSGMTIKDAFTKWPVLKKSALEYILKKHRINICVLDRSLYEEVFDDAPASLLVKEIIYETATLRAYRLSWKKHCRRAL